MSKVSFITNIRYGGLPVRKVYIGDKLIWQCIGVNGESKITLHIDSKTNIHVLTLLLTSGQASINLKDNFCSTLLDTLLISSEIKNDFETNGNARALISLLLSSEVKDYFKENAKSIILETIPSSSEVKDYFKEDAKSVVLKIIPSSSETKSYFKENTKNDVLKLIPASSEVKTFLKENISGGNVLYKDNITSQNKNVLQENTNGNIFSIILNHSQVNLYFENDSVLRCSITCPLASLSKFLAFVNETKGEALKAILSNGEMLFEFQFKDVSFSTLKALYIKQDKGNLNIQTKSNAIFWYPPIGDDVPLSINDGIDITTDGEILEIQQAYQVIIDDENKILEVI